MFNKSASLLVATDCYSSRYIPISNAKTYQQFKEDERIKSVEIHLAALISSKKNYLFKIKLEK